jgi:hypothetical protein
MEVMLSTMLDLQEEETKVLVMPILADSSLQQDGVSKLLAQILMDLSTNKKTI